MNLTGEQLQIASMIDAKMQKLVCDGNDDLTILGEMFDYMPGLGIGEQRSSYGTRSITAPLLPNTQDRTTSEMKPFREPPN